MGNLYFKQGHRDSNGEYIKKAEALYRKSLSILENDPYTWFALGHFLKRQERYEEALGAFQKTLSYMPYEDHETDHFGVSVHSTYQIQEIRDLIERNGGD